MVGLAGNKPDYPSPPLVTDTATIQALPLLYRLVADELVRKGRIIIQDAGSEAGNVP